MFMCVEFAFLSPLSVVIQLFSKDERTLSFGIPPIDDVFSGFKMGDFAVFYGHPLVKTLSFLLSVRCQLPTSEGGLNSSAVYLDGGNTFNPYVISTVARQHGLDPRATLKRIFVSRAFTAYQLSALILELLEDALKQYKSKLVLISDITSLFLDRDVPAKEAVEIFSKRVSRLSDIAKKRKVIIITSCFPHSHSRRRVFLESLLFGKANTIVKVGEGKGRLRFAFEKHPFLAPFAVEIVPDVVTLERFVEA